MLVSQKPQPQFILAHCAAPFLLPPISSSLTLPSCSVHKWRGWPRFRPRVWRWQKKICELWLGAGTKSRHDDLHFLPAAGHDQCQLQSRDVRVADVLTLHLLRVSVRQTLGACADQRPTGTGRRRGHIISEWYRNCHSSYCTLEPMAALKSTHHFWRLDRETCALNVRPRSDLTSVRVIDHPREEVYCECAPYLTKRFPSVQVSSVHVLWTDKMSICSICSTVNV